MSAFNQSVANTDQSLAIDQQAGSNLATKFLAATNDVGMIPTNSDVSVTSLPALSISQSEKNSAQSDSTPTSRSSYASTAYFDRPIKGDEDDDDAGPDDGGGGNNFLANLMSQVPFLGGLLGMFSGLSGLMSRSRSSNGCCNAARDCSSRMSARNRVDGLSSQARSYSYNMILGLPGYGITPDNPSSS